jgi:hypothetical protein
MGKFLVFFFILIGVTHHIYSFFSTKSPLKPLIDGVLGKSTGSNHCACPLILKLPYIDVLF